VATWLAGLDAQIQRSPSFFEGRPVVVDLSSMPADAADLPGLIHELQQRGIRVISTEGLDPSGPNTDEWGWPPALSGGRPAGFVESRDEAAAEPPLPPESPSLLIDAPVRSGQSVVFPGGDVTIVGSVASGSEIIAGGSIHVYGTLRGRAIAGLMGHSASRIFCRRLEAELLAINGIYRTADDMEANLWGRSAHAWRVGDAMMIATLD
jgi:septum site-determining protein MinC